MEITVTAETTDDAASYEVKVGAEVDDAVVDDGRRCSSRGGRHRNPKS